MSNEKYTFNEIVDMVTDAMSDWFDNLDEKDIPQPALATIIMAEAMNNLKMAGYCQHNISGIVNDATQQHIDMNAYMTKEEGTEPFPNECEHDDTPSFLEVMEPLSKRLN